MHCDIKATAKRAFCYINYDLSFILFRAHEGNSTLGPTGILMRRGTKLWKSIPSSDDQALLLCGSFGHTGT